MADAFHAGGGVDHVDGAFADGIGGASGLARATSDAIVLDFHCHGDTLLFEILRRQAYPNGKRASIDKRREFG